MVCVVEGINKQGNKLDTINGFYIISIINDLQRLKEFYNFAHLFEKRWNILKDEVKIFFLFLCINRTFSIQIFGFFYKRIVFDKEVLRES